MKAAPDLIVLRATRERLSNPLRWTAGAMARDAEGRVVSPLADEACCWGLEGALYLELRPFGYCAMLITPTYAFMRAQLRAWPVLWNDKPGRQHAEVLKALDVIVRRAEAAAAP